MSSDTTQLIKTVKACGWTVTKERKEQHWKVRHPESGQVLATIPATPGDWRSIRNTRAELKRKGLLTSFSVLKRAAQASEAIEAIESVTASDADVIENGSQPHEPFVHPMMDPALAVQVGTDQIDVAVTEVNDNPMPIEFVDPPEDTPMVRFESGAWGYGEESLAPRLPHDRRGRKKKVGAPRKWSVELLCEALATAFAYGAPTNPYAYDEWQRHGTITIDGVTWERRELFPATGVTYTIANWDELIEYAMYLMADEEER